MNTRLLKITTLMAAALMTVAACTSVDPYTGEERTSRASRNAAIGAGVGAVIGALTNTSSGKQAAKNALIGAGIGALAGGAVGGYQDRQAERLNQRLAETGVRIRRIGDDIELVMPGDITFATGQASITSNFYPVLDDVALVLNEFDKTIIEVDGHTDTVGSSQFNMNLSQQRSNSVASYLISRGVMAQRLIVRGFGETRLAVPTADGVANPANRRVEIRISPLR